MATRFPKLRADLKITRQVQKDGVHYVVKDPITQEYHRFPEVEFKLIALFDGNRDLQQIADTYNKASNNSEVSLEVVQDFHSELNKLHLIEKSLAEQNLFLLEKMREQRKSRLLGAKGSLMYFRISLLDPDPLLKKIYPKIRWAFTWQFAALCFVLFAIAGLIIFQEYERFVEGVKAITTFKDKTAGAIFSLWATVVIVIFFHELGHAFMCKHFGGEVHEMGILMLFFTPCFYANVNDAWSFPNRRQKLAVTFAGGWVEFIIGSWATILWFFLHPGTFLSSVSYQVMTICAVSSVMFNFNPLMKLDGYYAFSDFVEIPNLKAEGARYVKYMVQRYIFRLTLDHNLDEYTIREKRILLGYGICSVFYMTGVMLGLFWMARDFLVDNLRGVGVLLSFWVAWKLFKGHFFKLVGFFKMLMQQKSSWVKKHPIYSVLFLLFLIGLGGYLGALQSLTVTKTFNISPLHIKKVYAPISGFLVNHHLNPGYRIRKGMVLATLMDPENREARLKLISDQKLESIHKSNALLNGNHQARLQSSLNIQKLNHEIALKDKELNDGRIVSPMDGVILTSQAQKGYRPHFNKGSELFQIAGLDSFLIELPLVESELGDIKTGDLAHIRFSNNLLTRILGKIHSIAPMAEELRKPASERQGVENKFMIRVLLERQEHMILLPNMSGSITIFSGKIRGARLALKRIKSFLRPDLFL